MSASPPSDLRADTAAEPATAAVVIPKAMAFATIAGIRNGRRCGRRNARPLIIRQS
jgi:hypothetical protein